MSNEIKSRRKFLSGSAAAPLILTVHPGSAVAATSSQCQANDLAKPDPAMLPLPTSDPTNPDPDVWLRTEVVVLTLKDTSTNTIFPGQYIRSISGTNPDIYWRIDLTGFGTPQAVSTPVPGVFIQETPTGEKRRALVQVDTTTGTIIGFKWETKAGQKITKSCWTSFRP